MFSHVTVGSNDIDRARRFYDATFGAIGAEPGRIDAKGRLVYMRGGARFLVLNPIDGADATVGNGTTVALLMDGPGQVDAWAAAGVAHGGSAIEDPPGIRHATEGRVVYLAYLRDPDGNKLCGFHKVSG